MSGKHAFVPGDLVRWKTTSVAEQPRERVLGIVVASLGGTEEEAEAEIHLDHRWFRVSVFWMPGHGEAARFDTHPISALKLA